MTCPATGLLLVISGPSGVGKGSVCSALMRKNPNIRYSVSATTRAPRPDEQHGVNYYFISPEDFIARRDRGEFLEWAEVYGHYYGTLRANVEQLLSRGKSVILEIDTQGALQVKRTCPTGVFIFILPPSLDELRRRIMARGTETPDILELRLSRAAGEIALADHYDYRVVNSSLSATVAELEQIIAREQEKRRKP